MNTTSYFQKANKLKQEGKLEDAIASYNSAIEENPDFYWSYQNLAEVLAGLGKWDEAVTHSQNAIALNPNSAWSHYYLGEALTQLEKWGEAVAAYRYAIEIEPKSYQFHNKLGETLYQISLKIDQESLQTYINLAEVLFESHHFQGAETELYDLNDEVFLQVTEDLNYKDFIEEVYRTYLKREADQDGTNHYCRELANGMSRGEIISGFRSSQEFKSKLVECLRGINLPYLRDEIFLSYSKELGNEKFVDQVYRTYLKREPDTDGKNIYLRQINDGMLRSQIVDMFRNSPEFNSKLISSVSSIYLEVSILNYRLAIAIAPNFHKSYQNLGNALNQLGNTLKQEGKLDQAIDNYKEAITCQPKLSQALINIASAFLQKGQINDAIKTYSQTINYYPNWPQAHWQLGTALWHSGNYTNAINSYKKAITLQPDWADAHFHLGNAFFHQKNYNLAAKSYQMTLNLKPDWVDLYLHIANALALDDDFEEAKNYWQKLLDTHIDRDWAEVSDSIVFHLWPKGRYQDAIMLCQQAQDLQRYWSCYHKLDELGIRFLDHFWPTRIGHLALIDCYLKAIILGLLTPRQPILVAPPERTANYHALKYWHPYISIVSDPSLIDSLSPLMPYLREPIMSQTLSSGETVWVHKFMEIVQNKWDEEKRSPLISLSDYDYKRGWTCLESLGVPKNAWFVCLHVREPGYAGEIENSLASHRNAEINTYLLAVKTIIERGGWVIRMGNYSMKPLPAIKNVIDYANSSIRSDWMDVFLCSQCRFFLGTTSGLFLLSYVFGVPCALANFVPMETRPLSQNDLFIPKLMWSLKEKRYLTFSESLAHPIGHCENSELFDSLGIKVIDNTQEEINELVVEMLECLNGKLRYTDEDEQLQNRFLILSNQNKGFEGSVSRIGKDFLLRYARLMPRDNESEFQSERNLLNSKTNRLDSDWI